MRRIVRVFAVCLTLLLLAALSLPLLISANQFKPTLESTLSTALGRRVMIGDLRLSILSGGVAANSLAIAEDPAFGDAPFLRASSLKVAVELWPLIVSRKLNVTGLTIDQPQVTLLQAPSGRWNYSTLGNKSAKAAAPPSSSPGGTGMDLSAKLVRIVDGRFSMGKTWTRQKPLALDRVNLEVRDFSAASAFPFAFSARMVGGGDIKLEGKAGPIDAADLELTPLSLTLDVARLNLAAALAGTAPDVAGIASFQGSGTSAGGRLTLKAKLKADGLKLVKSGTPARRPVEFDFTVVNDLQKHTGTLQRGDIRVGSAAAHLTGTFGQRAGATELKMKFEGPGMPVPELAELLPPLGIALPAGSHLEGGTATASFTVEGPADRLVTNGSVALNNTRLANFDLGTKMSLIETLAGIQKSRDTDLETFSANVKMTPDGIAVDNLRVLVKSIGEMSGGGTVSPANALDFKMSATVQTTRSAALSRAAIPFFVQGTATNPVFRPDVKGLARTEAQTLVQSEVQKRLKGSAGQSAADALNKLFGGKKN
jgi:AsmA protein